MHKTFNKKKADSAGGESGKPKEKMSIMKNVVKSVAKSRMGLVGVATLAEGADKAASRVTRKSQEVLEGE